MVKPRLFAFPPYLSGFENQWFGVCFFNNGDFDCFLVKFWKFNSISENSTLQLACWLFVLSISFLLTCFLFWRFSCLPLVHLLLRLSARLLWLALFRRSLWCPPPLLLLSLYFRLIFIPLRPKTSGMIIPKSWRQTEARPPTQLKTKWYCKKRLTKIEDYKKF